MESETFKVRRKPSVFTAQRWYPPQDKRHAPVKAVKEVPVFTETDDGVPTDTVGYVYYACDTREGELECSPGDYIVSDGRSSWPVKPDYFAKHYEVLPADPKPPDKKEQ